MKLIKRKDDPIRDMCKNDPMIRALVFIKLLIVFLPIVVLFTYISFVALNENVLFLNDAGDESMVTGYASYKLPEQEDKIEYTRKLPEQYQFRALSLDSTFHGYELSGLRDFFYTQDTNNSINNNIDSMKYVHSIPYDKKMVMLFDDGVLIESAEGEITDKKFDQAYNFAPDSTVIYYHDKPAFFAIDKMEEAGLLFDAFGNQIWSISLPDSLEVDDPDIMIQSVASSVLGYLILVIIPEDKKLYGITDQGDVAFETMMELGKISFDADASLQFISSNMKDNGDPAFAIVQSKFNLNEEAIEDGPYIKLAKLDWESGNLGDFGIDHQVLLVNEVTGKVFDAGKNRNSFSLSNALSSNLSYINDINYLRNDGSFLRASAAYNVDYYFDNGECTQVDGFLQRIDLSNNKFHYIQRVSELRQMSADYHQATRIKIIDYDMNAPDFTYSQYQKAFSDYLLRPNPVNRLVVKENLLRIGPYLYDFDEVIDKEGSQFDPDKIQKIRMTDSVAGFVFSMIYDEKLVSIFRVRSVSETSKESVK